MVHTDTLVLTSDFSVSMRLYVNQKNPVIANNNKSNSQRRLGPSDVGLAIKDWIPDIFTQNSGKTVIFIRIPELDSGSQKAYGDPELNSGIREEAERLPRYTRNDKPASCRLLTHQKNPVIASFRQKAWQSPWSVPITNLRLSRYTRNDITFTQVLTQ